MKHVIPLNRFGTIRYKSVSFGIKLRLTEELLIPFQSKYAHWLRNQVCLRNKCLSTLTAKIKPHVEAHRTHFAKTQRLAAFRRLSIVPSGSSHIGRYRLGRQVPVIKSSHLRSWSEQRLGGSSRGVGGDVLAGGHGSALISSLTHLAAAGLLTGHHGQLQEGDAVSSVNNH